MMNNDGQAFLQDFISHCALRGDPEMDANLRAFIFNPGLDKTRSEQKLRSLMYEIRIRNQKLLSGAKTPWNVLTLDIGVTTFIDLLSLEDVYREIESYCLLKGNPGDIKMVSFDRDKFHRYLKYLNLESYSFLRNERKLLAHLLQLCGELEASRKLLSLTVNRNFSGSDYGYVRMYQRTPGRLHPFLE